MSAADEWPPRSGAAMRRGHTEPGLQAGWQFFSTSDDVTSRRIEMLAKLMTIDDIEVCVPDHTGWLQAKEIFAESVFLKENFIIRFTLNGTEYSMEDSLPEFLAAMTRFMNSSKPQWATMLLISGSKFEFSRSGGSVGFSFFDVVSRSVAAVILEREDAVKFHRELSKHLFEFIYRTFSNDVVILDTDTFRIRG